MAIIYGKQERDMNHDVSDAEARAAIERLIAQDAGQWRELESGISEEQLAEWRRLAEALPELLFIDEDGDVLAEDGLIVCLLGIHDGLVSGYPEVGPFVIAARQAVPALLAENAALRAVVAGLLGAGNVFINRTSGVLDFCRCCHAKQEYPGGDLVHKLDCAYAAAQMMQREGA